MEYTFIVGIEALLLGTLIGMWISYKIDKKLMDQLKKSIL